MIRQTSKSRLVNSTRNIYTGLLKQLLSILLTFLIRTAILYSLGAEYQGLSGLFSSILQVLNLSELGFAAAVTFVLYKPIAENDVDSICGVLGFLKKAYRVIGFIILVVGLALLPFLKYLVKDGDSPRSINIYCLYLFYLANAVVSYFLFAYKSTLLTALQRIDVVSYSYTITNLIGKVLQIIVLFAFKNYYVYVLLIPVTSISNNCLVEYFSRRIRPDLVARGIIKPEIKTNLIKQVKAVFINRIGDIARNSFDNIVISSYLGLVAVAIYDNYYYIYSALYGIMGIIIQSLGASIGNSIVTESVDKNYNDFIRINFVFMWIVGFCTICLFVLYQPFMMIWLSGKTELMLSFKDMSLFCLYFYVISMAYIKNLYLEARGLFYESRFLYILEAVGNLILNILMGKIWGITGVLLATIITIFFFNFYGGTIVLFKHYFKMSSIRYLIHNLLYFCSTVFVGFITYKVCSKITINGILGFFVKLPICFLLPNLLFLLLFFKLPQFSDSLSLIRGAVNRLRKR